MHNDPTQDGFRFFPCRMMEILEILEILEIQCLLRNRVIAYIRVIVKESGDNNNFG